MRCNSSLVITLAIAQSKPRKEKFSRNLLKPSLQALQMCRIFGRMKYWSLSKNVESISGKDEDVPPTWSPIISLTNNPTASMDSPRAPSSSVTPTVSCDSLAPDA
jgi:hypothetical protein